MTEKLEQAQEGAQIKKSPWIHAWSDPVAGITSYSQSLKLADLRDDGEFKLICVDGSNKMKIYKGTNVEFQD